jgi:hypothetical protein
MIVLLDLMVAGFIFAVIMVFLTQVAIPFVQGTPLFPNFRKDSDFRKKLDAAEQELEETTEEVQLREQLDEINRRKAELEKK